METTIKWAVVQPLIGGMALGAEKAFHCPPSMVLDYQGVGNSQLYLDYMKKIGKELPHVVFNGNLTSMTMELEESSKANFASLNHDIDVVVAVPICSGLSMANALNDKSKVNARGTDACQNNNMLGITSFTLSQIKPKVYIFENAPALYTPAGQGVRDKLIAIANEHGYSISFIKTNTQIHGCCQYRPRTFCIMWNGKTAPELTYSEVKRPSVAEMLEGIPAESTGQDSAFLNFNDNPFIKYAKGELGDDWRLKLDVNTIAGYIVKHNDFDAAEKYDNGDGKFTKEIEHIKSKISAGLNFMDNSPVYEGPNKVCTIFARTINRLIHPTENRGFTLRECMRFMGIPDDFDIDRAHAGMIGQNVPVMTSEHWCSEIAAYLKGERKNTSEVVNYQNFDSKAKTTQKTLILTSFNFKK